AAGDAAESGDEQMRIEHDDSMPRQSSTEDAGSCDPGTVRCVSIRCRTSRRLLFGGTDDECRTVHEERSDIRRPGPRRGRGQGPDQPGWVMLSRSSFWSSASSVISPRSTYPGSITGSRTVMPWATACLAIFAAAS